MSRAVTEYDGEQHGVEIRLTPPGARMALGVPMAELSDLVVRLEDVVGAVVVRRLVERLHEAPGWEERFAVLDALLARRLAVASAPPPAVVHAWRRLVATDGRVPVAALTEEVGWSRRHLAARFRAEVGLAPKALARILPFQRVTERLRAEPPAALAEVALECGYYDQAHLNRDFRALAGLSPTEFAARLLPEGGGVAGPDEEVTFVQDAPSLAA
jgi:AraC-like DNA-binding protein